MHILSNKHLPPDILSRIKLEEGEDGWMQFSFNEFMFQRVSTYIYIYIVHVQSVIYGIDILQTVYNMMNSCAVIMKCLANVLWIERVCVR